MTRSFIGYGLPILVALGLFVEALVIAKPAEAAACYGQRCCSYPFVWNYREKVCEMPDTDSRF